MGSAFVKDKSTLPFDAVAAKQQFPLIAQNSYLSYLDSGATSQKPQTVIDSQVHFYTSQNANIHRGVYQLSHEATRLYDESRETVRRFLNAKHANEVIFTSGATEGINLIAQSFGRANLNKDDEILLSTMEHHSNIVPWQLLAQEVGAVIKVIPVTDTGELDLPAFTTLLSERTRIVSIVHVSNALGTLNPVAEITALAHSYGAVVVIDGSQAAPHLLTDVQLLDCDFYVFSGHKVYAPMGTGALYGRQSLLQNMPPYKGGGDMILSVSFAETTFQDAPERFEAGTPNVAGAVGLAAAIEFMESFDADALRAYESQLVVAAAKALAAIPGVTLIGDPQKRVGVVSFIIDGMHPSDLGTILDKQGVAIRTGHHCTQPLLERFGLSATARASFAMYNDTHDIERLVAGIERAKSFF